MKKQNKFALSHELHAHVLNDRQTNNLVDKLRNIKSRQGIFTETMKIPPQIPPTHLLEQVQNREWHVKNGVILKGKKLIKNLDIFNFFKS